MNFISGPFQILEYPNSNSMQYKTISTGPQVIISHGKNDYREAAEIKD